MKLKTIALVVCPLTLCCTATPSSAQENGQQFEVANIYPVVGAASTKMRGGIVRDNLYDLHSATMVDLISIAYGFDNQKVIGGPSWLDSDRFDSNARVTVDSTPQALRVMLQALLADRFGLAVHLGTRPFPQYVLNTGKTFRLRESSGGESGCRAVPQDESSHDPSEIGNVKMTCVNVTMGQLASRLPQMAGNYFQLTPVLDVTGLTASYDFSLQWTRRNLLSAGAGRGISIYDAVDKQLGLKLEVKDMEMPVLVVDRVNEKPTENQPGTLRTLPAIPTEFEVAAIKPSAPGAGERRFRIEPSGRISLQGFTLKELSKFAWEFQDFDAIDNDEMLAGAPKWTETERFDIVAKPVAGAPPSQRMGSEIDLEAAMGMLRALLKDRFKMATHQEDRPVEVYALLAAKPRLKKADLLNRPGCRNAPVPPNIAERLPPIFSIVCQNTTMAQLSAKLQRFGGVYVTHPVVDMTGLQGSWDFDLSWSPPHLLGSGPAGRVGYLGAPALEPNGGLTLVEALDQQLGLKLKLQKHLMPVLVVDHIEPKPTKN